MIAASPSTSSLLDQWQLLVAVSAVIIAAATFITRLVTRRLDHIDACTDEAKQEGAHARQDVTINAQQIRLELATQRHEDRREATGILQSLEAQRQEDRRTIASRQDEIRADLRAHATRIDQVGHQVAWIAGHLGSPPPDSEAV